MRVIFAIIFGLALCFAHASAPAQPLSIEPALSDAEKYQMLEASFSRALTGHGDSIGLQDLFANLDRLDAAERSIGNWPTQGLARGQVRSLLDILLRLRTNLQTLARGDYTDVDFASIAAPLDQLTSSLSREEQPELWRNMSLMRMQMRAMLSMLTENESVADEIEGMLTDPAFASDQLQLRTLRVQVARGLNASWEDADQGTWTDLQYIIAESERQGNDAAGREARVHSIELLLAMRRAHPSAERASGIDLDGLPAAMAAMDQIEWPPDEQGEPVRLRVFEAHARGADLTQLTQQWLDAEVAASAVTGEPLWSKPSVLSWYIAAPMMAGDGREAMERQARVSQLLRQQPLEAQTQLNARPVAPVAAVGSTDVPDDDELLLRLGVDGIVLVSSDASAAGAQLALARRDGRRIRWQVRASGAEPFDVLDIEAARGAASSFQELAQLRGMGQAGAMLATSARTLFRIRFDTDPLRSDDAIYSEFGAALDDAFGGRCAGERAPRSPTTVLLIKSADLSFVPIHLARAPNGRRLIECYTFVHAPDVLTALEASERRRNTERPRSAIGLWNPSGDLPLAEAERAMLQHFLGAERVQTAAERAVKLTLFGEDAGPGDILHIAAHGRVRMSAPFQSGIGLGGADGHILVRDLLSGELRVRRDLVVLSACESGVAGTAFGPVAFYSLPNGFLRAGAGGVVSTLWSVRDDAAALVIGRFYRNHLDQDMAPPEALREAQLWLSTASAEVLLGSLDEASASSGEDAATLARLRTAVLQQRRRTPENSPPYADTRLWGGFAYFGSGERS